MYTPLKNSRPAIFWMIIQKMADEEGIGHLLEHGSTISMY